MASGIDALWDGLLHPSVVGGPVRDYDPGRWFGPKEVRQLDPFAQFSIAAADLAVTDAGALEADPNRSGVIFATGVGGFESLAEQVGVYNERGARRVSPRLVPMMMANAGAAGISMRLGWRGPCEVIVTACAAGTHAIAAAGRLVASGRCDVVLSGGAEASLHPTAIAAFANMTALSTSGASRPFDVRRDGFVMTEGSAALVLEDWDRAVARGATIYAELAGAASTADAHHITAPAPDGAGAVACMELALSDAGISTADVGHINAHGTSTPLNDLAESTGHHQGLRRARTAGHLHQGSDGARAGRGRRHRGRRRRPHHPPRPHPPDGRLRRAGPRDHRPGGPRRAPPMGPVGRALELLRVRRPQRLPRPAPARLTPDSAQASPLGSSRSTAGRSWTSCLVRVSWMPSAIPFTAPIGMATSFLPHRWPS